MILALATGAAILLSAVATALLALVLIVLFNTPFVVALPLVALAYVSIWLIIPLCLVVNLICAALSRKDLPIHIAAIVCAGLLWLTWGGAVSELSNKRAATAADHRFGRPGVSSSPLGCVPLGATQAPARGHAAGIDLT